MFPVKQTDPRLWSVLVKKKSCPEEAPHRLLWRSDVRWWARVIVRVWNQTYYFIWGSLNCSVESHYLRNKEKKPVCLLKTVLSFPVCEELSEVCVCLFRHSRDNNDKKKTKTQQECVFVCLSSYEHLPFVSSKWGSIHHDVSQRQK